MSVHRPCELGVEGLASTDQFGTMRGDTRVDRDWLMENC